MQLIAAKFCVDCEEIFVGEECPKCGQSHSIFLTQWIVSFKKFRP